MKTFDQFLEEAVGKYLDLNGLAKILSDNGETPKIVDKGRHKDWAAYNVVEWKDKVIVLAKATMTNPWNIFVIPKSKFKDVSEVSIDKTALHVFFSGVRKPEEFTQLYKDLGIKK